MRTLLVASVLLAGHVAAAGPLPKGLKVFVKDQRLTVSRDGVTLPMVDPAVQDAKGFGAVKGAQLSADGKTILVDVETCSGDEDPFEVSIASIDARFANRRGMQLHQKKKFADAIPHFVAAVEADRDQPVYATNLLSAQAMARRLDDADKTLTTYGPAHRGWFAWRLAVDPELASMVIRPAARALVASAPTKLTYKGLGDSIAISPRGLVAVSEWTFYGGPGAPGGSDLALYDLASGREELRLPIVAVADACYEKSDGMVDGPTCTAKNRARTAARVRDADRVLMILGFAKQATAWVDVGPGKVVAPDKKTTVDLDAGTITRGVVKIAIKGDGDQPQKIGFASDVVVLQFRQTGVSHCDGDAQRSWSLPVALTHATTDRRVDRPSRSP